jgi:4-hydroxy 2-oxovalerate aldolase
MRILDCTLRDGGYYNNWDFKLDLVKKYLQIIKKTDIDTIEIGFRFVPKTDTFLGPYAYSTDDYLNFLGIKKSDKQKYAVMINETDASNYKSGPKDFISKFFIKSKNSPISIVRVAVNAKRLNYAEIIIKSLKKLNYSVILNIMQIDLSSDYEIEKMSKKITKWNLIKVLYFADSLGGMDNKRVKEIYDLISRSWKGDIGFHGHDNCRLALKNSNFVNRLGAKWIDSTILGMGRGAGNTKTEQLLKHERNKKSYNGESELFKFIKKDFRKLKKKYKWGSDIFYQLAAKKNVHPTYIQKLKSDTNFNKNDIFNVINYLSKNNGNIFSPDKIKNSVNKKKIFHNVKYIKNIFKNKDLLILGPGEELENHKSYLENYIIKYKPIVLSGTLKDTINKKLIDYYVTSNFVKNNQSRNLKFFRNKNLILPFSTLDSVSYGKKFINYELVYEPNKLAIKNKFSILPSDKSLIYALAISVISNPSNTFIIGFDGYSINDIRRLEINKALDLFHEKKYLTNTYSLTRTSHNLKLKSLYTI